LGLVEHYPVDAEHLRHYVGLARTADGFARYLAEVLPRRTDAA
jgi:hypothetical protein